VVEIKDDKKLITLKEAAKLSGYSSDYIGQLIRAGKIPGKQIYTNITWVTTTEAVLEYKQDKNGRKGVKEKKTILNKFKFQLRRIKIQLNILRLFFQTFKSAIPLMAVLILTLVILGALIFQGLFYKDNYIEKPQDTTEIESQLTF
jgi:hypothetical protein